MDTNSFKTKKVIHEIFGTGIVATQTNFSLSVYFRDHQIIREFPYPACFKNGTLFAISSMLIYAQKGIIYGCKEEEDYI